MKEPLTPRSERLDSFDQNGVGQTNAGIFGLPFSVEEARLVVIAVPWDVTVSNHAGTAGAPGLIHKHSSQIDLYDEFFKDAWMSGIASDVLLAGLPDMNAHHRKRAKEVITFLEAGNALSSDAHIKDIVHQVNAACRQMNRMVFDKVNALLVKGQIPCILGGDHSTPLGAVQAIAAVFPGVGVLQIDAHADLRKAYQGFEYSHASVMRHVAETDGVGEIVQVGIREFCDEEIQYVESKPDKLFAYTDREMHQQLFHGNTWSSVCEDIVDKLPGEVYVTFDMDGLDPSFCPHTGTPVPGGMSYNQAMFLLETLVKSGRVIVGADIVETGAHDYDAMMAARVLYKICGMAIQSHGEL